MRRSTVISFLSMLILLFCSAPLIGDAAAAAFPGAMGYGSSTPGGRGGRVIAVTNLNDSGPGSFRAACEASGPRIVVFRTGGTIKTNDIIKIRNPYITIAGQTAPGDGICLRGGGIYIWTHDVVIRGMRVRVGDATDGFSPADRDGINMDANMGDVYNVVIDHCSVSWAIDEIVNLWGPGLRDVTISNTIVSEGLYRSIHPDGPHSMGFLVGPKISNVSIHGNLLAHNAERNPRLQGTKIEVVNNLVYNRAKWDVDVGGFAKDPQDIVVEGNYFKKGPSFKQYDYSIYLRPELVAGSRIFAKDNISTYTSGDLCTTPSFLVEKRPFSSSGIRVKPAAEIHDWVLANVGANPMRPDPVDARIYSDVKNGTGRIVDSVAEAGGWPTLAKGTPPVDSDGDGMPDQWEIANGLNPNHAADANSDRNNDGYTNIEEYINSFYSDSGSSALQPPFLRIVSQN